MATNELVETPKTRQPDPEIRHEGKEITLPALPTPMTTEDAIKTLERKLKDENTVLDVHERISGHPLDALVAFNAAMKELYGWSSPVPTPGFFGPEPPKFITVETGPKAADKVQVPHGSFILPNIKSPITTHLDFDNPHALHVTGAVKKKEKEFLVELANKAREILRANSIYRGRAVRLKANKNGDVNFNAISFIDTDDIIVEELIMNPGEMAQLEGSLWTPIRHTDRCIAEKIPLNRGVLLEGTFGIGKTMSARVTSRICTDNDWTYILLDDVRGIKDALEFARRFEPCVLFAEDIDRVLENRDQTGNDILNTIDGVLSKNSKVITVLTTNHVDKLDRAMLRPGRLDAVISVRAPEDEAVKRLVRLYGGSLVDEKDDLKSCSAELAGNIPATIREVVERSKLFMIADGRESITDENLTAAAKGMADHLALLNRKDDAQSDGERLASALVDVVSKRSPDAGLEELSHKITVLYDELV